MGYWTRKQAEICIMFTRGNPSYRGSQDKREFYDRAGAKSSELRRALNGMKEYEERGRPDAAQAIFADLDEPGKLFVTSQMGTTPTRRLHPLERARVFAQEGSRIIGELNGAQPKDQGIPLPPMSRQTRRMVGGAIERVTVAELRNAMIATRQPGFENRKLMDREGYWADLRDMAPEVAAELERRLGVGSDRAYDYEAVMTIWPQVEQRLKAEDRPLIWTTWRPTRSAARSRGVSALRLMGRGRCNTFSDGAFWKRRVLATLRAWPRMSSSHRLMSRLKRSSGRRRRACFRSIFRSRRPTTSSSMSTMLSCSPLPSPLSATSSRTVSLSKAAMAAAKSR